MNGNPLLAERERPYCPWRCALPCKVGLISTLPTSQVVYEYTDEQIIAVSMQISMTNFINTVADTPIDLPVIDSLAS